MEIVQHCSYHEYSDLIFSLITDLTKNDFVCVEFLFSNETTDLFFNDDDTVLNFYEDFLLEVSGYDKYYFRYEDIRRVLVTYGKYRDGCRVNNTRRYL